MDWIKFSEDTEYGNGEALVDTTAILSGDGYSSKFSMRFPAYDVADIDDDKTLLLFPRLPIVSTTLSDLKKYNTLHETIIGIETDSMLWEILNPFSLFENIGELVENLVECGASILIGDFGDCACIILRYAERIISDIAGSEDDVLGAAHYVGYFLNYTDIIGNYIVSGSNEEHTSFLLNGIDTVADYVCGLSPTELMERVVREGVTSIVSVKDEDSPTYIRARLENRVIKAIPVENIQVKLINVHVIDDRDGIWRGEGDTYLTTYVGIVGDKAISSNSHSLSEDLEAMSSIRSIDVHRLPESGNIGIGSGDTHTYNEIIYDRRFGGRYVAGLYIHLLMMDEDTVVDDMIGLSSIFISLEDAAWEKIDDNTYRLVLTLPAYSVEGYEVNVYTFPTYVGAEFTVEIILTVPS